MMDEIDEILDKAPFYIEQVGIRQVREKVYYSESAINSPKAAVDILAEEIRYYDREVIGIVNVDSKLTPLNVSICSIGTINRSLVNPREMLKTSILSNASGVVVMHNHPSGSLHPSKYDDMLTQSVKKAAEIMRIHFTDHVIVTDGCYYSYAECGKL